MSDSAGQIKELKVSGHTMALEPGLYCVYHAPGSPAGKAGGLPGVRVTVAPSREGAVSVVGFSADGWIGADEGALVRVAGGAAEVLVTVYQASNATGEPPNLQVVRLSGPAVGAAAPAEPKPAAKAEARPVEAPAGVEVMAHIYARGDVGGQVGAWMGEPGSQRWIEGFGIAPTEGVPLPDIEYQAVLGRGWLSPWSEGGQFCGSRGMSLPILGLRVRLRGESEKTHRVVLSASFVDGTRIGPVGGGDACEAPSLAALEAFQVAFEPVTAADAAPAAKAKGKPAAPAPVAKKGRAKAVPEPVEVPKPARKGRAPKPEPEPPAASRRRTAAPARRR